MNYYPSLRILASALMMVALGMTAAPIPAGLSKIEVGTGTNTLTLFTYKPHNYNNGPLVMVFHGALRNAETYCSNSIPLAERYQALIIAPLFDTNRFPQGEYGTGCVMKKGVLQPRSHWAFTRVPEIIQAVRQKESRPDMPYYFIGHSGGGQFTMRLTAMLPTEAVRIVVANPGTDLFPRRDWKYGYGFGGLPEELSDDAALRRYLAAPLTLCLGLKDTDPLHPELDKSAAAEKQGAFRLERGRACFAFAQALARERGWSFNWRKVEVPGIAHDGGAMLAAGAVQEALLKSESSPHP